MDAIKWQQFAHKLYNKRVKYVPGLISSYIHFRCNSDISPISKIGKYTTLGHRGIGVVIHPKANIGSHCIIAQNVTLAGKDGGAPQLGDYVYVGHGSIVMGGVKIGNNVFIGALTLVNKDIPDNAIVAGIPSKILRYKTEKEIEEWKERMHQRK